MVCIYTFSIHIFWREFFRLLTCFQSTELDCLYSTPQSWKLSQPVLILQSLPIVWQAMLSEKKYRYNHNIYISLIFNYTVNQLSFINTCKKIPWGSWDSLFNFYNIFYPFSGYLNSDYFYRLCHKNKLQRTSLVMIKHKNKLVANENCFTLSSQLY